LNSEPPRAAKSTLQTTILDITNPRKLLDDIAELTGITIVTKFRYLGLQIKSSYVKSRAATYEAVHASMQWKFEAINSPFVDLFPRQQLIRQVFFLFSTTSSWPVDMTNSGRKRYIK
jgi:hypothetical protein